MFRYLLLALAIWIGVVIVRQMLRRNRLQRRTGGPPPMENMVQCARCGTHLPESSAIAVQGRYYCCEQHRREDRT